MGDALASPARCSRTDYLGGIAMTALLAPVLTPVEAPAESTAVRQSTPRTFLMCPPEHFTVAYAINAWMDTSMPVDTPLAVRQWTTLLDTYVQLGHVVHVLDPEPGLPDMVFAANGALSVDGAVYGASFAYPERAAEADAHRRWYDRHGWPLAAPEYTNEGEGDFAYVPGPGMILAGYGFRTDARAHAEAQDVLSRPVVGLRLVDPRFYHLDTALFVLDDNTTCYYPGAFSPASQRVLQRLFPTAVLASEADAMAFGLNAVSDGRHVVLPVEASGLARVLADRGYVPVSVDLSELRKGGGSVKCCTAELRS
jgi:N-dimethylarginine dimethylaminohydrolase